MRKCVTIQTTSFYTKINRWFFKSVPLWKAWTRFQPNKRTSFLLVWKQTGCKHSSKIWGESFNLRKEMVWERSLQLAEHKEKTKMFQFQVRGKIFVFSQVPALLALSPHILCKADNAFLALLVSKITFMVKINSCNAVFGSEWSNNPGPKMRSPVEVNGMLTQTPHFFSSQSCQHL